MIYHDDASRGNRNLDLRWAVVVHSVGKNVPVVAAGQQNPFVRAQPHAGHAAVHVVVHRQDPVVGEVRVVLRVDPAHANRAVFHPEDRVLSVVAENR